MAQILFHERLEVNIPSLEKFNTFIQLLFKIVFITWVPIPARKKRGEFDLYPALTRPVIS